MAQSRTYGYALDSSDDQVESAEHQTQIIERYCERLGRRVDGMYADRVGSENQRLFDRESGRQLQLTLRRGDHVVVARLDRLDRSFKGFTRVLRAWAERGVVTHLCDMPMSVLDPGHRHCEVLIKLIVKLAEHERRMIGQRTSQGLAVVKSEGRRYSRNAPFGFAWERRGKSTVMVAAPKEREICAKAAELKATGLSIDRIRQHLAYKLKVRNRNGREFNNSAVHQLAIRGAQWLNADVPQGA
jgi:DNA invertase Pin-like site-specific DNA recombinase